MSIRTLFSNRRPIDRPIEKVIDYYATEDRRLVREIEEYEVTDSVERCFRRFLEVYDDGVRRGQVTEVGIWVSGFYGSGKSSFTKYLGFALDPERLAGGRPFIDMLCERLTSNEVQGQLRTIARQQPTAVVLLDLGSQQLASTASAPVSTVLYWQVLQWAGYSKEKKLAQLEFTLDKRGLTERFLALYQEKFGEAWGIIHNDPMIGVARAAQVVPQLLPKEFPTPQSFSSLKFDEAKDTRDLARDMIDLVRRKTGRNNILFLVDEAGQYVAARSELILNLDGLARNLKELGEGKVWLVATGQQTLSEIVEKSAFNSDELNKLRDRFPISISLDARDIREITYRRLLSKSPEGDRRLAALFAASGQSLITNTRLTGTALFKGDPDAEAFSRFYPFLPQHFDLLLELIRTLARSTGGIGLRSAIRVIQDLLVDVSNILGPGEAKLADRPICTLACADDFYNTLRADISKVLPHVVQGVDRVARAFPDEPLALRVAKAVAALQAIEGFPKTPENVAAVLYPGVGALPLLDSVREILRKLVQTPECSLIEDPQAGGYLFLSEGVKPLRDKRNAHVPSAGEMARVRNKLIEAIFDPLPSAKIENAKEVRAGIRFGRTPIVGEREDIQFRIEECEASVLESKRATLLSDTNSLPEYKLAVAWLISCPAELNDQLVEACRSDRILDTTPERDADRDVAQFLRAERRSTEAARKQARKLLEKALLEGTFVYQGGARAVTEKGQTLQAAARTQLQGAASSIFSKFRLVPIRPATDLAKEFVAVERIDRITREFDPLALVAKQGGSVRVNVKHPALAEVLRVFGEELGRSGTDRVQGSAMQDFFAAPPYGWSKDATRYLFAALFRATEIELHTPGGMVTTAGPLAIDAFKSTVAFNRVGVGRRDSRLSNEALDRAATRLQEVFGVDVLPLEEKISQAARDQSAGLKDKMGSLPDRLRLLDLPGEERSKRLIDTCSDLTRQDGSNAPAILGAVECSFPADVRWGMAVVQALNGGAETEIRNVRELVRDLQEIERLFPASGAGMLDEGDQKSFSDILNSEGFAERLPDLRKVVRMTLDRVVARYQECREAHGASLRAILNLLETMPEWTLVTSEDRSEIAGKLTMGSIPAGPTVGKESSDLRLLLTRDMGLAGLQTKLEAEVRRRVPPPPAPGPTDEVPVSETTIELAELESPAEIRNAADLEGWLSEIRRYVSELLKTSNVVRITGGKTADKPGSKREQ